MQRWLPVLVLLVAGAGAWLALRPRGAEVVGEAGPDRDGPGPAAPGAVDPRGPRGPGTLSGDPTAPRPASPDAAAPADGPTEAPSASVTGRVVDDATGDPVPRALVIVRTAVTPCPTVVDGDVLADADPGRVSATYGTDGRVERMSSFARTDETGAFAAPWPFDRADLFVRGEGFVVAIACGVARDVPTTVRLRRGGSVDGVVEQPDGKPVAGVRVRASPPRGLPATPGTVEATTTDAEGRFALRGLGTLPVDLRFWHDTHVDAERREVPPGTRGLRVVMQPAFAVTFRVTTDDRTAPDAPTVEWRPAGRTPEGPALLVLAEAVDGDEPPGDPPEAPPPAGTFRYRPVRVAAGPPTVVFVVKAVNFEPWTSEPLEVPPGGGATTLDVPLRRDPTVGRVAITLEDRDHRRLGPRDERVAAGLGRRDGRAVAAGVIVQMDERVVLPAIEQGPWRFLLRSPRWAPATLDLDVRAQTENEATVVLTPTARLRVRFVASEALLVKFRVTQGADVLWPFVEVVRPDGAADAEETAGESASASGGDGTVLSGLPAGRLVVEVVSPELTAPATPVDLVEGETRDVEITVRRK